MRAWAATMWQTSLFCIWPNSSLSSISLWMVGTWVSWETTHHVALSPTMASISWQLSTPNMTLQLLIIHSQEPLMVKTSLLHHRWAFVFQSSAISPTSRMELSHYWSAMQLKPTGSLMRKNLSRTRSHGNMSTLHLAHSAQQARLLVQLSSAPCFCSSQLPPVLKFPRSATTLSLTKMFSRSWIGSKARINMRQSLCSKNFLGHATLSLFQPLEISTRWTWSLTRCAKLWITSSLIRPTCLT